MSLLSRLLERRRPDLGRIDPNDIPGFFRLAHAVRRAERDGSEHLCELLASHGIRDREHWRTVVISMGARHGRDATYVREAVRLFAPGGRATR